MGLPPLSYTAAASAELAATLKVIDAMCVEPRFVSLTRGEWRGISDPRNAGAPSASVGEKLRVASSGNRNLGRDDAVCIGFVQGPAEVLVLVATRCWKSSLRRRCLSRAQVISVSRAPASVYFKPLCYILRGIGKQLIQWFRQAASRLRHEAIARNPRQDRRDPRAETQSSIGRVAQLAEQLTLNQ